MYAKIFTFASFLVLNLWRYTGSFFQYAHETIQYRRCHNKLLCDSYPFSSHTNAATLDSRRMPINCHDQSSGGGSLLASELELLGVKPLGKALLSFAYSYENSQLYAYKALLSWQGRANLHL